MKIDLRFRHVEAPDGLRQHTIRHIHFQLSRFGRQVSSVSVRVSDVNGPRGGVDKRCRVAVRGPSIGALAFESLSADAASSVEVALGRAARSVARDLDRYAVRSGKAQRSLAS